MKVAIMADIHFHDYKPHSHIDLDGVNSRLNDCATAFRWAANRAVGEGASILLIAGDVFHVRGAMKPSVINVVRGCIKYAVETCKLEVGILAGNHDMEDFNGGPTAIDFLTDHHGPVYVLNKPGVWSINKMPVLAVPYQHTVEGFRDGLAKAMEGTTSKPEIALFHQGIDDFKPRAAMPDTGVTAGFLRALVNEHVGPKCAIFSGHYHVPHADHGSLVFQVGALLQHNLGDEGTPRGILIYDTEKRKAQFATNNVSPRFVTVGDEPPVLSAKGSFVRIKASTPEKGKELAERFKGEAADVIVSTVREFTRDEGRPVIKPGTVRSMVEQYVDSQPGLVEFKGQMLSIFDRVCK